MKNKEWLKNEISENWVKINGDKVIYLNRLNPLIDQLDEPEVSSQIDKLANFIMSEVEGEPSQSQSAVDTAIRIIKSYENQDEVVE